MLTNKNYTVVTIFLSHHKFTPSIAKKLKMQNQDCWVKMRWSNAAYISKQKAEEKNKQKK